MWSHFNLQTYFYAWLCVCPCVYGQNGFSFVGYCFWFQWRKTTWIYDGTCMHVWNYICVYVCLFVMHSGYFCCWYFSVHVSQLAQFLVYLVVSCKSLSSLCKSLSFYCTKKPNVMFSNGIWALPCTPFILLGLEWVVVGLHSSSTKV